MVSRHYVNFLRRKLAEEHFEFVQRSLNRVEIMLGTHPINQSITKLKEFAASMPSQKDALLTELELLNTQLSEPSSTVVPYMVVEMQVTPIDRSRRDTFVACGEFYSRGDSLWFDGTSLVAQPTSDKVLFKLTATEVVTVVELPTPRPSVFLRIDSSYRITKPVSLRVAIHDLKIIEVTRSSLHIECEPIGEKIIHENVRIGRQDTCEIQIKDPKVSKLHAQIFSSQGHWFIEDKQSANGLWLALHGTDSLNSSSAPQELEDGSKLFVEGIQSIVTVTITRVQHIR